MDLVLCHTTADFDTLGAAVGLARLHAGARIVLAEGCHPTVYAFLALHRDEYPLVERRAIDWLAVQSIGIVDTQRLNRLGAIAPQVAAIAARGGEIVIYDHHPSNSDIAATATFIEPLGAATTIVVEQLQAQSICPTATEATVMALGIHVDTGSLTFPSATVRDARALAWLMEWVHQSTIAEFVEPALSPPLQMLLETALARFQRIRQGGQTLGWVLLTTPEYVPGLSSLAERLIALMDVEGLVLGVQYATRNDQKLTLIGRARGELSSFDFGAALTPLGGGGHASAAAVTLTTEQPAAVVHQVLAVLRDQIPPAPMARDLMSAPVRTIRPETPIAEAQRILLRYGHSGLSVVSADGQLVGMISRRDIDLALHHGFAHAPVKGYMTTPVKTISPTTPLSDIEALMVTYDIGRLPVMAAQQLVGIVTRTDVLRQLHQAAQHQETPPAPPANGAIAPATVPAIHSGQVYEQLQQRLPPPLWGLLADIAAAAQRRQWQLYVIGGAVRDLFLAEPAAPLELHDVDLVVDSASQSLEMGAGVVLAQDIQAKYSGAELQVYGRFQTAALVWRQGLNHAGSPLLVDIATARTEFYPYPAANPEVEASSIRQDLYRRDFTINALAVRLTPPHAGQLLDFFGGLIDLQRRQVRVLHANSFIEDPTRIFRAVRFAVRLGFTLETQTETFIRYALESGIYRQLQAEIADLPALQTRLRAELKSILEAPYWEAALALLETLEAFVCLHGDLRLSDRLWQQLRQLGTWLQELPPAPLQAAWLIRLELLLTVLSPEDRKAVAENLQLPQNSINRLATLPAVEAYIQQHAADCRRPSQWVQLLCPYDTETLLLIGLRQPVAVRDRLWQYLTHWSLVKAPLNGNDLKQLGYAPGPQYRPMLEALLAATLDGVVTDQKTARTFITEKYSRLGTPPAE